MNVTIEDLGPCKRLIRVEIEADAVEKEFTSMVNEFRKQVEAPGFRPGKAPRAIVEKTYGARIEKEVKKKLKTEAMRQAIKEHDLKLLRVTDVEEVEVERGADWTLTATAELQPEFELPEYRGLPARVEAAEVTDEDVDKALQTLRDQRAEFQELDREAAEGDYVEVDYTGTIDGKPLTEIAPTARGLSEQKDFRIQATESAFIPGFGNQLIGARAGEQRTVKVTFPEDFVQPRLSGLEGVYEVTVKKVKERVLPEIDDEFAKSFGAETLHRLKQGIRGDLENDVRYKRSQAVRQQVSVALLDRVDFELPETTLQMETRNIVYDIVSENQRRGMSKEAMDQHKDEIYNAANANARGRLKFSFLAQRIAGAEGIEVQDQDLVQRIAYLAARQEVKPEKLAKQLRDSGRLDELREEILVSKVLNLLEKHAKIEEVAAEQLAEEQAKAAAARAEAAKAEADAAAAEAEAAEGHDAPESGNEAADKT